ncbi:hypothetical protein DICSQDRAFT_74825, partial [Dichomitus squalens LYAD-421 SS1]
RPPVLEVLVVRLNLELGGETFEVVTPRLQGTDNREHLLVVDLVVPFSIVHGLGVVCDRVKLSIIALLGQDHTGGVPGGVDLNSCFPFRVIDAEDRTFTEPSFDLVERALLFLAPLPGVIARKSVQRFADGTEVVDESSVKVGKATELPYVRSILRSWPVCNSLDFDRVHAHASFGEDHAQILDL